MAGNSIADAVTLIDGATSSTTKYIELAARHRFVAIQIDGNASAAGSVTLGISVNGTTFDDAYTATLGASSCEVIHLVDVPVHRIRLVAAPSAGNVTVTYALGHGW